MIQSMTAFAQKDVAASWGSARWEVRSVNHRYLELSVKLPEGLRDLEVSCREFVRSKLARGKVDCFLRLELNEYEHDNLSINQPLVTKLIAATQTISRQLESPAAVNPMSILSWSDVVEKSTHDFSEIGETVQAAFQDAIRDLMQTRQREGESLFAHIQSKLDKMHQEVVVMDEILAKLPGLERQKILKRLEEVKVSYDETRFEQELVHLLQKSDICEEIDRLKTHLAEFQRHLTAGKNIGRRLDFLLQELNREANTIAAKSVEKRCSLAAVELKVLIEQIREQVQNIE